MLLNTVPDLCQYLAYLLQQKVEEISFPSTSNKGFLKENLDYIVYHAVAVGFSLLVFMKGKSFKKLALNLTDSLR